MKKNNHLWGARRISAELVKLDIHISKSSVANILVKHGLDPTDYGLTWKKFLSSHINSIIACDFKTVTSYFGKRLYVFFFISHQTREILHFSVTDSPNHRWMNQQLRNLRIELDHDDKLYLIRDNDILYQHIDFKRFDLEDIPISIQSPDMNAVMERFIGSFKREALDHFLIFIRHQLENITKEYVHYYNHYRPHQGIGNITIPHYKDQLSGKAPSGNPHPIKSKLKVKPILSDSGIHGEQRRSCGNRPQCILSIFW